MLSEDDFTFDDTTITIHEVNLESGTLDLSFNATIETEKRARLTFKVGSRSFSLSDATVVSTAFTLTLRWENTRLSWSAGDTVQLSLTEPYTVSLSASPDPVVPVAVPGNADAAKRATVTITATLNSPLSTGATIPVTVSTDNPDHGLIDRIVIARNETTGTAKILVLEDLDTEDDTFTVDLVTARLPHSIVAGASPSATVTVQDTDSKAAPGAVGSFAVTPKHRYLLLTWDKPSARTTHYDVQYKTAAAADQMGSDNDPATGWISLPKYGDENATTRRVTRLPNGLTNGTAYDVRVRAVNWTANGPWATGQGTPVRPGGV